MNLLDVQHVTGKPYYGHIFESQGKPNVIVYARINYSPSTGDLAGALESLLSTNIPRQRFLFSTEYRAINDYLLRPRSRIQPTIMAIKNTQAAMVRTIQAF